VHLHFTLSAPRKRHYTLLPKAIGQLAEGVPFEEVELSLTQGRWVRAREHLPVAWLL